MTPLAIARAVDTRDDGLLEALYRDDAVCEAWIEARAEAVYHEIYAANIDDGATDSEIRGFAMQQAKREARHGLWVMREEELPY